jgi:hypothetical protein
MMQRKSTIILLALLSCGTCFGQTAYQGLTPGKSTRADVEGAFGKPVKEVSSTLHEYKVPDGDGISKVYLQYRDPTSAAIVERIELICDYPIQVNRLEGCTDFNNKLAFSGNRGRLDAVTVEQERSGLKRESLYYGLPALWVLTERKSGDERVQFRVGLYSPELYQNVVPKGCTGTFLGIWETNRGRMTLTATPKTIGPDGFHRNTIGTYAAGNGSVTAMDLYDKLPGEWKDATGSGTFELKFASAGARNAFTGTWRRTSGKGPKDGSWEGRCVETKAGGND